MKESKGVYVTKRHLERHLLHREYQLYSNVNNKIEHRYGRTKDIGVQYDSKRDNVICTCRNYGGLKRHEEARYFSASPKIYEYNKSRSFTDIGVGSVRALQKKKVKRIYAQETDDRGVGSSDLSSLIGRRIKQYKSSYYENKKTSSKCVGGFVDNTPECVINAKLSPIVRTRSGTTSPKMPSLAEKQNTTETDSNTVEKQLVTTTTQIDNDDIKDMEAKPAESKAKSTIKTVSKQLARENKPIKQTAPEKVDLSKKDQIKKDKSFSSDSLVQHVHNLENPSEVKSIDMENKLEKEYRRIFLDKGKDKPSSVEKPMQDFKSASLLKRRFDAIRRTLGKKDDSKNAISKSSQDSVPSRRDVSVTSDPPSLEGRSYSNTKTYKYNPYPPTNDNEPMSYKKSYTGKTDRGSRQWSQANTIDSEYAQGVKGMFKLWGKKFNLEENSTKKEETTPQQSSYKKDYYNKTPAVQQSSQFKKTAEIQSSHSKKPEAKDKPVKIEERPPEEKKGEKKKFSFFKKKNKDKGKDVYKSKKVTAGRCEVRDGLMIKIGGAKTPPITPVTPKQNMNKTPESYEEILRKAWLMKYLTNPIDSRNSVKVRWNNKTYATSSSTIFELMENVYKETGVVFKSKSEILTEESSYRQSSYNTSRSSYSKHQHVNFVQNVEAWMIPTITNEHTAKLNQRFSNNDMQVKISDQKWLIDKSKAFARKIELVLHSNNFVRLNNTKPSSEYIRIDIPKGFFYDSSTDDSQPNQTSEEVFKIVEYETLKSSSDLKKSKVTDNVDGENAAKDIKVTISFKEENERLESKILETVIKRPPMHRDVVTQGSNVYIPKKCDVIGVGIITQRDVREVRKPILKIMEYFSDEESDKSMVHSTQKKCEFAESYLRDYYRNWTPLGMDLFSWCMSDSHLKCCSENNSKIVLDSGDVSKSCPNIFEDYLTSTIVSSCPTSSCSQCCPVGERELQPPPKAKFFKFKNKKPENLDFRILPKDSFEVFKKRKLYAMSNKSNWNIEDDINAYSIPSKEERGAQDTIVDCPKLPKSCYKDTQPRNVKKKSCNKHVSLPDCDLMNDMLAKRLQETVPGILTFKSVGGCDACKNKNLNCPKHATLTSKPSVIKDPNCRKYCQLINDAPCSKGNTPPCSPPLSTRTSTTCCKNKDSTKCPPEACPPALKCPPQPKPARRHGSAGLCQSPPPSPPCRRSPPRSPERCQSPTGSSTCSSPPESLKSLECPPQNRSSPTKCCKTRSRERTSPKTASVPCSPNPSQCYTNPPPIPEPCSASPPCASPPKKPIEKKPAVCKTSPCKDMKASKPIPHPKPPKPKSPPCNTPPCKPPPPDCSGCNTSPCNKQDLELEFPWPRNSRMSNQSSSASISPCKPKVECIKSCPISAKALSQPKVPEKKIKKDKECLQDCANRPKYCPAAPPPTLKDLDISFDPIPPQCPKQCASRSKISGIFLRKLPSRRKTCATDCKAWNQIEGQEDIIRLNSREKITIKLRQESPSTEEIRECVGHKIQDEDGQTICERKDYGQPGRQFQNDYEQQGLFQSSNRPSPISVPEFPNRSWCKTQCGRKGLVGDVYKESHINRVATVNRDESMERSQEDTKSKSESSVANTIEINFNLRVTQGDKTTEVNIENNDTDKPSNNQVGKATQDVFIMKDSVKNGESQNLIEEVNPKNDINIKILIKNYKHKSDKKKRAKNSKKQAIDEDFSRKISDKFHTVSTGYSSDFKDQSLGNVFSIHRATIDLTESVEKSKSHYKTTGELRSGLEETEITKRVSVSKSNDVVEQNDLESTTKLQDIALKVPKIDSNKKTTDNTKDLLKKRSDKCVTDYSATDVDDVYASGLYNKTSDELTTDIGEDPDANNKKSDNNDTDVCTKTSDDQDTDLTEKSSDEHQVIIAKSTREEKKELLKKVFEKANYLSKPKNKSRIKRLKEMLKSILTSDSSEPEDIHSEEMVVASNELANDMIYPSLKPNFFKNSESLNNYYQGDSNIASAKCSDMRPMYPTEEKNSICSEKDSEQWSEDDGQGCVCSTLAARLKSKMCNGGGCCCQKKEKKKQNEETTCDIPNDDDCNHPNYSSEYIDVETQNSKHLISKDVNVSTPSNTHINNTNAVDSSDVLLKANKSPTKDKRSSMLDKSSIREMSPTRMNSSYLRKQTFLITDKPLIRNEKQVRIDPSITADKMSAKPSTAVDNAPLEVDSVQEDEMKRKVSIKNTFSTHEKRYELKTLDKNTKLGISDDDKIVFLEHNSTTYRIATNIKTSTNDEVKNDDQCNEKSKFDNPADILQLYETKKAVLEIYAEKTETGEHLVAKLPKFVYNNESEISQNYKGLTSNSYKTVHKSNFVLMSIGR